MDLVVDHHVVVKLFQSQLGTDRCAQAHRSETNEAPQRRGDHRALGVLARPKLHVRVGLLGFEGDPVPAKTDTKVPGRAPIVEGCQYEAHAEGRRVNAEIEMLAGFGVRQFVAPASD